jgi:hypothetical protein
MSSDSHIPNGQAALADAADFVWRCNFKVDGNFRKRIIVSWDETADPVFSS